MTCMPGGAKNFFSWLARQKTAAFADVSAQMVETYVAWRQADLQSRGRTGGMVTEGTVLASIFSLAMEEGLLKSNPLRHKPRKPGLGLAGAEPFSPLEMASLTAQATEDRRFPFLVFRWTGMRCSDVAAITWSSWDREAKTLHWLTAKRKKWVTIPLTEEMNQALTEEHDRVRPEPGDQILAGATKAKLYKFVTLLGRDAGVVRAHPHRFRDSLAVSILAGGGTIYDAAKVLGILVSTAERHYAPFTEQLQGRVRKILESA